MIADESLSSATMVLAKSSLKGEQQVKRKYELIFMI